MGSKDTEQPARAHDKVAEPNSAQANQHEATSRLLTEAHSLRNAHTAPAVDARKNEVPQAKQGENSAQSHLPGLTIVESAKDGKSASNSKDGAKDGGKTGSDSSSGLHMSDSQAKDATVRHGEGPYQVASRLLGKDASEQEKHALVDAVKGQYNKDTNNIDPKMNDLPAGYSLMNDKNAQQVLDRIGDKAIRDKIGNQLNLQPTDTNPQKPGSDQPQMPGGDQPQKPGGDQTQKPAGDQTQKPAGDQTQKPAGDQTQKPGGDQIQKPGGDQTQKPGGDQTQKPGGDQTQKPGYHIDRSQFDRELSDPRVMAAFAGRMNTEVGSQGPSAQLAFAEEVMNRAASRHQTLMQALSGSYYPTSHPSSSHDPRFTSAITNAWKQGTDTNHGATGNASGNMGFGKGGRLVARIGGEKFGYEEADLHRGWLKQYEQLKRTNS